ncbi:WD40-repeat-containing domain protein [Aspergillus crustosus]
MASTTAFNATNHGLQIGNNTGSITAEFHVARAYTTEDIDRICLHALRCPDSLAVKSRLKESKDKLVHQSIQWILEDPQYKDWENGDDVGLLWIKGGAGKGKTMLSIGLIEVLARAQDDSTVVIYSFCQNADYELNTLEAILKGLILQLANQQPELKELLRRRWDTVQECFSEDLTSWQSLWNVLFEMLARCKYSRIYMAVDALDECQDDDVVDFLKSIVRKGLDHPGKIKWMLTSRPWDGAERVLLAGQDQVQINLDGEYNTKSVSGAVEAYIAAKVEELSRQHRYGASLKSEIETVLTERSEGTFLWVSLVCKALESVCREDALSTVQSLPPGLHPFYERVLNQLNEGNLVEVQKCMRLLKAMMTVYRPLRVEEVPSVIGLSDEEDAIRALVDCCASFIRLREDSIEFVHQSARDYLAGENGLSILASHERFGHEEIVVACLSYLSGCLKPNLAELPAPYAEKDSWKSPENGPKDEVLLRVEYAASFWVSHLKNTRKDADKSQVSIFLHTKLLEWLECLSLLERLPSAFDAFKALENILTFDKDDGQALAFVQDATRFLLRHYPYISNWPLQIYGSSIIFSPESSVVKRENLHKIPAWLGKPPAMEDSWSPMIQTLTHHTGIVHIVAFSPDGKQIASGSVDGTIKLWDTITGGFQKALSGHSNWISAMAFLPDSRLIMSGAGDGSIMLWDTTTGDRQEIADHFGTSKVSYSHLKAPEERDSSRPCPFAVAFSADRRQIAALGDDQVIMLFDAATGDLQKIVTHHPGTVLAVSFSPDDSQLISGCSDHTVRLWDTTTGNLQKALVGATSPVYAVVFSPDGQQIASGSNDAIHLWNAATGDLQKTLPSSPCRSVVFSPDSKQFAAGFVDGKIHIWDAEGNLQNSLASDSCIFHALAFSADGKQIATGSSDTTVRRWDITIDVMPNAPGHSGMVTGMAISPDGKLIASGSAPDENIKLWDAATGKLLKTLAGPVFSVFFSPDNRLIVSYHKQKVNVWDAATGDLHFSPESDDAFESVAFSPDSKQLATGHLNGNICLWDTVTGALLKALAGHKNRAGSMKVSELVGADFFDLNVKALAWSADSKLLASGSSDRTTKLWDPATGDLLKTLVLSEEVLSVAFSSDGQQIACAIADKSIDLWSVGKNLRATKFFGRTVGSHIKSFVPQSGFHTPEQVYRMEFAAGDRYLITNVGPMLLGSTSPAEDDGEQLPVEWDLYVQRNWLYYGPRPFFRLLPDFAVGDWVQRGDQVAIGFTNGQFASFHLDRRALHSYLPAGKRGKLAVR